MVIQHLENKNKSKKKFKSDSKGIASKGYQ